MGTVEATKVGEIGPGPSRLDRRPEDEAADAYYDFFETHPDYDEEQVREVVARGDRVLEVAGSLEKSHRGATRRMVGKARLSLEGHLR